LVLVVAAIVLGLAPPAGAHPLGNFTVNRYARVEVSAGVLRVHYVLDEAEIPAFQDRAILNAGREAFAARRAGEIGDRLLLTIDGAHVPLRPIAHLLTEPAGQGGLHTLRLAVTFVSPLPPSEPGRSHTATFVDDNEPDRLGWREILVVAVNDGRILESDVGGTDLSSELRRYPNNLLSAPLDRRRARFMFVPGSTKVPPSPLSPAGAVTRGGGFAALVTRSPSSPLALLGVLAVGLAFGAVHALGPGHGKTVMAAYLAASRGRVRDAFALGGVIALLHTLSVLALGVLLFRIDRSTSSERVYPWLTLGSGVVVTAVAGWLLLRRWRGWTRLRWHGSGGPAADDGRTHDHDHHGHGHPHRLPSEVRPFSPAGIVALGASGGIFPSPSAVVVLVSAFSLDRAVLGLVLVAAFSVGLALTLGAVGCSLVLGHHLLERRGSRRLLEVLPLVGAALLLLAGLAATFKGVAALR